MMRRRLLLGAPAALVVRLGAGPAVVHAQSRAARRSNALRIGADPVIERLTRALLRGFGVYSGLAAQLDVAPSAIVLEAVERGEVDAALTLAPDAEAKLQQQGLLHSRQPVARLELLLVGPTDSGIARGRDVADALRKIAADRARFVGRNDGSGLHLTEQALWRAAGVAPAPPWYIQADSSPLAQARAYRAHLLLDRASWTPGPARDKFGVVVEGDARLEAPVHVVRSFRATHPAGKLFVGWVTGPVGRKLVAGEPGLRSVAAAK